MTSTRRYMFCTDDDILVTANIFELSIINILVIDVDFTHDENNIV